MRGVDVIEGIQNYVINWAKVNLAVAETSRRMAAKSLKMRVFLDIFEIMFDVTLGELQEALVHGDDRAISGSRFKAFSDHPPACLDEVLQY